MVPAPPQQQRRSSLFVRKGSTIGGPMREVELDDLYVAVKPLASLSSGRFGITVNSAEDKQTKTKLAVKIFQKGNVKQVDFIREYNFSYFLAPHQNIIETYDGVYSTSDTFFFVQELCPLGNLKDFMDANGWSTGLTDTTARLVVGQVTAAVEFMHIEGLVYRNIRVETILVFSKDLSRIKIADFGLTRKQGAIVKHMESPSAYHAPELCDTLKNEAYGIDKSVDIWAMGVLIYYLLRARYPWAKATIMCKPYWEWEQWLKRKSTQTPTKWTRFSDKAMKLFRLTLNPKAKSRCTIKELKKILKYKWLKETKSVSDDVLYLSDDSTDVTKSQSVSDLSAQKGYKRRSVLQQWIATTISTMTEISEQVVSAAE